MKKRRKRKPHRPAPETPAFQKDSSDVEPALPARLDPSAQKRSTGELIPEKRSSDQAHLWRQILLQDLDLDEEEEEEIEQAIQPAEEELHALLFRLCEESYALDIGEVEQIVRYIEPTDVPHTVDFLEGIVAFRGRMVPVINARKRMGRDARKPDRKSRIIIVRDNHEYLGILVDSVTQVVRLPLSSFQPTPPVVPGGNAEFMEGVAGHHGKMVILLNTKRFLQIK